ncbi:MAG: hypothetical protein JOY99_10160 [Sphingomonadaceae bacterium]|nr:hypothetical protein [Sphingomonadaceae bacterium]
MISLAEARSPARLAFVHFLRTGIRLPEAAFAPLEAKFNPYHDPTNGQFTSGPGGGAAGGGDDLSGRDVVSTGSTSAARPVQLAAADPEPPRGIGDNYGGMVDPTTLEHAFPGLAKAPGGSVLAVADGVLDLTGPGVETTSSLSLAYSNALIADIKRYDPSFRYDSLGFPQTLDGQMNEIGELRWDRAAAIYRATGDDGPLQVETLRYLQAQVDKEYDNALLAAKAGELPPAPTERMAIGNYIDQATKASFRDTLAERSLTAPSGQAVRVNGREYDSSGDDLTYSIPDARVGNVAYDVTLWRKIPNSSQIRRFFNSDFKPRAVAIIRPTQLGAGSTYIIKRTGH